MNEDLRKGSVEPIEILLVEDSPGDVRLVEEALTEGRIANEIHAVHDGMEGLAYLRQEEGHEQAPRPDLILLDLNLPRLGGHEFLERVKEDPELKEIPVVVLTTSEDEQDLHESYRLQAAGFITKPVDAHRFLATVRGLGLYWVCVVNLPREG